MLVKRKLKLFNASGKRVGVVVSRFNGNVTAALLKAALKALRQFKVKQNNVKVVQVAGSIEIPYALKQLAKSGSYDCLVALGCVIQGETPHFDYVCKMAQEGILRVSQDYDIPIGFGVLTLNDLKQAGPRVQVGAEAAAAALELSRI